MIDAAISSISFLLAFFIRYKNNMLVWQREFYSTLLIVLLLLEVMYHYHQRESRRFEKLIHSDPIQIFTDVFRDRFILIAVLVIELYLTHNSAKVSRLVLGYFFVLDFLIDFVTHIVLKQSMRVYLTKRRAAKHILIVTTTNLAEIAVSRLNSMVSEEEDVVGLALLDNSLIGNTISGVTVIEDWKTLVSPVSTKSIYDEAFLYLTHVNEFDISELIDCFERRGVDTYQLLSSFGEDITANRIREIGDYRASVISALNEHCKILDVDFTVTNVDCAVSYIRKHINKLKGQYICFGNAHTTVMSRDNAEYCQIQNNSAFTFADGTPIAKAQLRKGFRNAQRVAGPDFMDCMFRDTMDGKISHFFYGSTEDTVTKLQEELRKKYPGINIIGVYSPPFRKLTEEEDKKITAMLNAAGADIIWVGLGAPKQEKWMAEHQHRVQGVMMGVGAGFNFFAGTVKRAPKWIQRAGFEWLYRLMQEPKKLIKRYLISNIKFIAYSIADFIHS